MLFRIATVAQSAAGRSYANDINGRVFFPKTKDMEVLVGHYGYAVEQVQTKTTDEDGNLIDLVEPRKIWQITATFPTKALAIEAAAEAGTLSAEVSAEVAKVAKSLNLSEEAVSALAAAAF
jgi:hypothetical protein